MFQEITKDDIIQATEIIGLKSKKNYYKGNSSFFYCPFHEEKKPSLSISFDKQIYHCFSCGSSGTVNDLVKKISGESLKEVLGIENSFLLKKIKVNYNKKEFKVPEVNIDIRGVLQPFMLFEEAKNYLKQRKINLRIAQQMNMKYADLVYINGTTFYKRLCIPIYEDTKLINVEGRDVTKKNDLKCLYPKNAKKTLFEYYKLDRNKPLYLVEGIMDLAILREDIRFKNSTALMGTVSEDILPLLDLFKEVIIIPDNDTAGKNIVKILYDYTLERKKQKQKTFSLSGLFIKDSNIKDVGDIPIITNKSFEEAYNTGLLKPQIISNFSIY